MDRIAQGIEDFFVGTAAAVFVFGVNIVGDVGELVVSLIKAAVPGGG